MRPPGFPGNPPVRMPRAPTPARSPPPRPLRGGDVAFRPTQDVGPRDQRISGLNPAAYALPVNASRPGSPQAHASLGSGWRPTLAGWDWIPTGFRTRFRRSHHVILSPLTGLLPAHTLGRVSTRCARRPSRHGRAGVSCPSDACHRCRVEDDSGSRPYEDRRFPGFLRIRHPQDGGGHRLASWTSGYATARSEAICRGAGCGRTRTSGSVGGRGQQRPWSTRPPTTGSLLQ